jgi:ribosomal protein L23
MAAAPKDFYSDKLQPFMASVLARNISPTSVFDDGSEGSEQALRLRLLAKAERNLSLFVGSATKLAEKEEVVRLTQVDLDRLESAARKRQAKNLEAVKDIFEVNIVSVRTVVDKGRVRSRVHEVRPKCSTSIVTIQTQRIGIYSTHPPFQCSRRVCIAQIRGFQSIGR